MGISHSDLSKSHIATAKLILQDGKLQEFSSPVKVSEVLKSNSTCFVCDSDDLVFGEVVSAIHGDEELQLGQLYFELPSSCLKRPVRAEEIAALAVKASVALRARARGRDGGRSKFSCCGCGIRRMELEFTIRKDHVNRYQRMVGPGGGSGDGDGGGGGGGGNDRGFVRGRRGWGNGRGGGSRMISKLSAIVEEL
ncbi:hypothetical protein UlMin_032324 [Ulmus minor]